ncbi:MAG: dihydropteroate synthase [Opitutus sp.]
MKSWTSPHGRALPAMGRRTLIMGVLNATPDSFSDGGQLETPAQAVERARSLIEAGADVLDIGGESTRPGATTISADEELARVVPVIDAIRQQWPELPLSIDTYKSTVADAAIEHGADIVNDVWGLMHGMDMKARDAWSESIAVSTSGVTSRPNSPMAEVVSRRRCPVILMHNRPDHRYGDFWEDVLRDLSASIRIAQSAGIESKQIWTDPGFGFAKNVPHNLEVLRELHRVCALGYPVLVGTSRKSTIGAVLGTDVSDRLEGGGATVVWAIQQGCAMIRVHDVPEMARYARMADAIKAGLSFKIPS